MPKLTSPLVEFAGLPGCGKTTLANHLKESLKRRGIAFGTRQEALARAQQPIRRPLLQRAVGKLSSLHVDMLRWKASVHRCATLVSRSDRDFRASKRRFKCYVMAMYDAVCSRPNEFWFFDEGVTQRTFGLGASVGDNHLEAIRALLRSTNRILPFRVVILETTPEIAWQRIQERFARTGRSNVWCSSEGRKLLDSFYPNVNKIADCLAAEGLLLARIDATAGVTEADAEACCDRIFPESRPVAEPQAETNLVSAPRS